MGEVAIDTRTPGALQDYLRSLMEATDRFRPSLEKGEKCDPKALADYAAQVRDLSNQLNDDYGPEEGRSRIIDKFFAQWNNLVFGVIYAEENQRKNGGVSERQRKILDVTMQEIKMFAERYGAIG